MHCTAVLCRETVLVRFCGGELEFVEILALALFGLLNLYMFWEQIWMVENL